MTRLDLDNLCIPSKHPISSWLPAEKTQDAQCYFPGVDLSTTRGVLYASSVSRTFPIVDMSRHPSDASDLLWTRRDSLWMCLTNFGLAATPYGLLWPAVDVTWLPTYMFSRAIWSTTWSSEFHTSRLTTLDPTSAQAMRILGGWEWNWQKRNHRIITEKQKQLLGKLETSDNKHPT